MSRRLTAVLPLSPLCMVVLACGGGSPEPSTTSMTTAPPSTTSTTEAIAVFPGDYATSITAEELKNAGADNLGLAGDWILTFATPEDSMVEYVATLDGVQAWTGTMILVGDEITVSTNEVGKDCQDEGSYTWAFDGTSLTFSVVSDGCVNRLVILAEHPLVRRP